jgi:hypothetical protein
MHSGSNLPWKYPRKCHSGLLKASPSGLVFFSSFTQISELGGPERLPNPMTFFYFKWISIHNSATCPHSQKSYPTNDYWDGIIFGRN